MSHPHGIGAGRRQPALRYAIGKSKRTAQFQTTNREMRESFQYSINRMAISTQGISGLCCRYYFLSERKLP